MKKQFGVLLSACLVAGLFFTSNVTALADENDGNVVTEENVTTNENATINPYEKVEAEHYNIIENAGAGCNPVLKSCGVDIFRDGYIGFRNVDFAEGANAFDLRVMCRNVVTDFQICIDSIDNPIGHFEISSTDGLEDRRIEFESPIKGVHDVYFKPNETFSIDYWNAEKAPVPEVKSDLTLEYGIESWGSGHKVDFKVVNNTDKDILGWALKIKKSDCQIDQSWSVNVKEDGDYYYITPFDWDSIVPAGGSVDFGITGAGEIGESIEYVFVEPVAVDEKDIALDYDVQCWGTGFNVFFKLTNNSDNQLNGWSFKINKSECKIDASWGVNIEETDDCYILTPMDWNAIVNPHSEINFGIQGSDPINDSELDYTLEYE